MATGSRCGCSYSVCCYCCWWYCCIVYSAQTKTKMQSALQWELGVEDGIEKWGGGAGHDHSACSAAVTVAESSQNIHGLRFRRTAGIAQLALCALSSLAPSPLEHLLLPPTIAPLSTRAFALTPLLLLLLLFLFPLLLLLLLLLFLPHQLCLLSYVASSSPHTAVPSFPSAPTPSLHSLYSPPALPITSPLSPPLPPPPPSPAALATTFYGLIEN